MNVKFLILVLIISKNYSLLNCAIDKIASASSCKDDIHVASKAVDGNTQDNSKWISDDSNNDQWIMIDLERQYLISTVILRWDIGYGVGYEVEISSNNVDWTNVYSTTNGIGGNVTISFSAVFVRYVKINCFEKNPELDFFSMWEFEIYCDDASYLSENFALGKEVSAASVEESAYPPSNAVDGYTNSRWSSSFNNNQWIMVDLGMLYNINIIILRWEAAYGTSYRIDISSNNVDWDTIYSTIYGHGENETISFPTISTRYVRMHGLTRETSYEFSL
jgi:hypothetical protein